MQDAANVGECCGRSAGRIEIIMEPYIDLDSWFCLDLIYTGYTIYIHIYIYIHHIYHIYNVYQIYHIYHRYIYNRWMDRWIDDWARAQWPGPRPNSPTRLAQGPVWGPLAPSPYRARGQAPWASGRGPGPLGTSPIIYPSILPSIIHLFNRFAQSAGPVFAPVRPSATASSACFS